MEAVFVRADDQFQGKKPLWEMAMWSEEFCGARVEQVRPQWIRLAS